MSEEKVNTINPDADKDLVKRRKMVEFQEKDDLKKLVESDFGRRFLYRLLDECGIWSSIRSPEPNIHYLEGKREVGLILRGRIKRLHGLRAVQAIEEEGVKMEVMVNG